MTRGARTLCARVAAVLLASAAPASAAQAGPTGTPAHVLEAAIKLLATPLDVPIRLIDPELTPDPETIRRTDAFVVREPDGTIRRAIYVNSRSAMFQNALRGRKIDIAVLAGVLHHELEHLRGADETSARKAEMALFRRLIWTGEVPVESGLTYFQAMLEQHRRTHAVK